MQNLQRVTNPSNELSKQPFALKGLPTFLTD